VTFPDDWAERPADGNNWGRWGADDEVGTANLLGARSVVEAARLIKTGRVISLALPLERNGPVHPNRSQVMHMFHYTPADSMVDSDLARRFPGFQGSDDYIFMPLQASTQWDGLAHAAYGGLLYNGHPTTNVDSYSGARKCGIQHMRDRLVGRGVLLDVPSSLGIDRLEPGFRIEADHLDETCRRYDLQVESGDIVLIRTGHIARFYELDDRADFWKIDSPGIGLTGVDWLHEHDVAAAACDNVGFEADPPPEGSPCIYPLHVRLIRDLGLTIGELWWLEELAAGCADLRRWTFFLTAPPLNVTHAAGSPLNPLAIF
jgi:kynurenine formamidase